MNILRPLTIILFLGLLSCAKDQKVFIPDQEFVINQELVLSQLVASPKSYIVDILNRPYLLKLDDGAMIEIPESSIADANGNIVTGEIKIEFKEFATKKSNLIHTPGSIYDSKVFNAKKMIYINFTQQNEDLYLQKPISIYIPDAGQPDGEYFQLYGQTAENGNTNWKLGDSEHTSILLSDYEIYDQEAIVYGRGFALDINQVNKWICIASFNGQQGATYSSACVTMEQGFTSQNTLVYFISSDMNTVFKMDGNKFDNKFCKYDINGLGGLSGKIITISDFGEEKLYFGTGNAVLNGNTETNVVSVPMSLEEIKEILASL